MSFVNVLTTLKTHEVDVYARLTPEDGAGLSRSIHLLTAMPDRHPGRIQTAQKIIEILLRLPESHPVRQSILEHSVLRSRARALDRWLQRLLS
jgi:hypothetical protein